MHESAQAGLLPHLIFVNLCPDKNTRNESFEIFEGCKTVTEKPALKGKTLTPQAFTVSVKL